MKKILTSLTIAVLSLFAANGFAQTSMETIPYSDGNLYLFNTPVNIATGGGAYIMYDGNTSYGAGKYWDLSAYAGVEIKFTFPAEATGVFEARFVFVGSDAAATAYSIVKPVTYTPGGSAIARLSFAADNAPTKKLWAIKTSFGTVPATDQPAYGVQVDYVNALTTIPTAVKEISISDPNALVDVYSVTGAIVRKNVKNAEATNGLTPGIYLVGGKKVVVTKQ